MKLFQQISKLRSFRGLIATLLNLFLVYTCNAQRDSCPEKFRAYSSTGKEVSTFCVGETIRFKSCSASAQPDKEYYDSDKTNGLAFPDTIKSFSYTEPGTYTVTQLINTGLPGNNQYERTFTVLPTPLPKLEFLACAFNKINFKITDTNYHYFRVDFGDGTERRVLPGKDTVYQYSAPGKYTVIVKAAYRQAACIVENSIPVSTLPGILPPVLNRLEVNSTNNPPVGMLLIASNLQTEYEYIVEQAVAGSNNFTEIQRIKPVPGENKITVINSDARPYHYRLQVTDACGTKTQVFSNELFTQSLEVQPKEKSILISWPAYPNAADVQSYQVYRDAKLLKNVNATSTMILDDAVSCGRQYCYQVVALLKENRSSVSNQLCQQPSASTPPTPGVLITSFNENNQVILTLQPGKNETVQEVNWEKKPPTGSFTLLATSKQITFAGNTYLENAPNYCYRASYSDSCGLVSGWSNISCPVILKTEWNEQENKVSLNWSPYVGFQSIPNYIIEVINGESGQLLSSIPAGSRTTYTNLSVNQEAQTIFYRIKASGQDNQVSFSNTERITQPFSAGIPTAFSPNNDGLNDVFEVKGQYIKNVNLKIFNRWGQQIFESTTSKPGWDGKINGKDAPVGTYLFSLEASDHKGNTIRRTGSVTLIK